MVWHLQISNIRDNRKLLVCSDPFGLHDTREAVTWCCLGAHRSCKRIWYVTLETTQGWLPKVSKCLFVHDRVICGGTGRWGGGRGAGGGGGAEATVKARFQCGGAAAAKHFAANLREEVAPLLLCDGKIGGGRGAGQRGAMDLARKP